MSFENVTILHESNSFKQSLFYRDLYVWNYLEKTIQYLYSITYCDPYEINIDYLNEIIKRFIIVGNKICIEKIKARLSL